jgi:glycosyltransferase involved in cell wall biosynthesis
MKRVIFYIEPEWAFGSIHYELSKYLFGHGFDCRLLPWNRSYTIEELKLLFNTVDIVVTTGHGWRFLGHHYGVLDPSKVVVISHAKIDITELIHHHGKDDFDKFKSYGCVSQWLIEVSKQYGINRPAVYCPLGINTNLFDIDPSSALTTVGYAGAFQNKDDFTKEQIESDLAQPKFHKRAWLVKEAADRVGLDFKVAQHNHNSFVTMPGFYSSVDCIISASSEEGAGLPIIEAGAAGRLVITTEVGHAKRIGDEGGYIVPVDEQEFLQRTTEILAYYKYNPSRYRKRCLEIKDHAQRFDWSYQIKYWIELLS